MNQIINRWTNSVIVESEDKSIIEMAESLYANLRGANLCNSNLCNSNLRGADLCGANLCGANLCGANLCGANLRGANLCGADLCGADLCGADLCGANLCGADLCGAKWIDKIIIKYISIGPVGSRDDYLQIYKLDDGLIITTGCFNGNLSDFKKAVEQKPDDEHRKMYMNIITMLHSL